MGSDTRIEWATHTFNPWRGCTHAILADGSEHPGCGNCYAEAMAKRNPKVLGTWGPEGVRVVAPVAYRWMPFKWNAKAESNGARDTVFCASVADVFEAWTGPMVDVKGKFVCRGLMGPRTELFRTIALTPWLMWLLLTKRPFYAEKSIHLMRSPETPWQNVMVGTSVSDQATADVLIPPLLDARWACAGVFVSYEPALGPVDFTPWLRGPGPHIDWLIMGGESGHHHRPMNDDWIRATRDQCRAAAVPFFFKQMAGKAAIPLEFDIRKFPKCIQPPIRERSQLPQ